MSFRRRLLIVLAATVFFTVGAVSWVVSVRTRSAFERAEAERTAALVAQFQREFSRRGEDVVRRIEAIAGSETVQRMALELSHGADSSAYLTEAAAVAESHQLDLLEFVAADGSIISSAQWPARFGYRVEIPAAAQGASLQLAPLPEGATLGLVVVRAVRMGEKPLFVIGGERLDREFMSSLTLPAGMRALLYPNVQSGFSPQALTGPAGAVEQAEKLAPLIARVQQQGGEADEVVQWSGDAAASEAFHAIPLKSARGTLLGIVLVGSSRRGVVELQRHITALALIVGGAGILLAILLSGWAAARVTRPIERLADASREVAAGNWQTQVEVGSQDEIGQLAESFNSMTRQLLEQRDRVVQAERVAAWRELARRLAHELKNPLFPLQITVENLLRSRDQNPEQFDEVFRESTSTLLAELGNLKAIIGRFSDFSKMPQPQIQPVAINDAARQVLRLHDAQFHTDGRPPVATALELDASLEMIDADPDLLHRALSNLVLNALDAMPEGGTLIIRTVALAAAARIEVSDTGSGLTREECERLFTPYYTTKRHGTGLGLAIVQSVVSDHHGSISVESTPGQGTTFRIDLPRRSPEPAKPPPMFTSAVIS
jgi:two-component system, NtrC family, nitrogen regulation sensor histidine kinase NtrY